MRNAKLWAKLAKSIGIKLEYEDSVTIAYKLKNNSYLFISCESNNMVMQLRSTPDHLDIIKEEYVTINNKMISFITESKLESVKNEIIRFIKE